MCLATTTLVAVITQLVTSAGNPAFDVVNFCSYFTIVGNVFAAVVLAIAATVKRTSPRLDVVRGAATLCMVMVGIVFSLLLRDVESDLIVWVNVVVHYLMPIAILIDWSIDPPHARLRAGAVLLWLTIPLAYVAYTLIRGSIVRWYPYPFLDVPARGANVVAGYVAALTVLTSLLATLVAWLGNARFARSRADGRRDYSL